MKTCQVCGCYMEDNELVCPECGATVVKPTSGLSLKAEEPEKKKRTNPIGMSVSTGSGLTDILRADDDGVADDDPFNGGSIPISITRTVVDDYDDKPKKSSGKIFSTIIKLIIFAAIVYGAYYLVTNVILKEDKNATYEGALEVFFTAVSDNDAQAMAEIVPTYISGPVDEAQMWIDSLNNANITEYNIISKESMDDSELTEIEEYVKLELNKTADIREGVLLTVEFRGTSYNNAGNSVNRGGELKMQFIRIKDNWYFYPENFDNSLFTK